MCNFLCFSYAENMQLKGLRSGADAVQIVVTFYLARQLDYCDVTRSCENRGITNHTKFCIANHPAGQVGLLWQAVNIMNYIRLRCP